MEYLDKETQMIAVEKVLEEMEKASEYLSSWNACWWEQWCARTKSCISYMHDIQEKYYNYYLFEELKEDEESEYLPLRKAVLEGFHGDKYPCEFHKILWGMKSNKSKRSFSFENNGEIHFSKDAKGSPTIKKPKFISYETSYNVLSNDVFIDIKFDVYGEKRSKEKHMIMSLNDKVLTRKYDGIEIIIDFNTGVKSVKITKDYDEYDKSENNASVFFEARFNADKVMEMGAVEIRTHKGNGKINGTYRLDASIENGISANFISRKGVKVDLITNPMLAGTANNFLLPVLSSQSSGDMVISDVGNSTQSAIAQNLSEKVIIFDNSDFNIIAIQEAEKSLTNIIKEIKGELPLNGLVERINNCLDLITREQNLQIEDSSKVLRLESDN